MSNHSSDEELMLLLGLEDLLVWKQNLVTQIIVRSLKQYKVSFKWLTCSSCEKQSDLLQSRITHALV